MNRKAIAGVAGALIGALVIAGLMRFSASRVVPTSPKSNDAAPPAARGHADAAVEVPGRARASEPKAAAPLSPEEKAESVAKIKRDYDEIRLKTSADYSAAGAAFPGGLNAFLRQLALLEREKRADLATVLTPRELEDLELRETTAGQLIERLLAPTNASEEQRRAVFRLQRGYEDQFALTFDVTPHALLARETARQQTQEQIHAVLGDDLFGSWLYGEGEDYGLFVAFTARERLSPSAPFELRRAKNDYTLRRLELNATVGLSMEQLRTAQAALAQQTEARLAAIIGPAAVQAGRGNVLSWLPKK